MEMRKSTHRLLLAWTSQRFFLVVFTNIFLLFPMVANAVPLSGTVHSDGSPVAGARVMANNNQIAITDGSGFFSTDVASGHYNIHAEAGNGSNFSTNFPVGVNISHSRELRLTVHREVILSGSVAVPADLPGRWGVRANQLDGDGSVFANRTSDSTFEVKVPAGKYALRVVPVVDVDGQGTLIEAVYSSYTGVDASHGSVSGINIPLRAMYEPVYPTQPPVAARIQIGTPDEYGITAFSGSPGAANGAASISLINLQTGQYSYGSSSTDGSFSVSIFAPPGASVAVYQNPTGEKRQPFNGAGTVVRVPISGEASGAFATGTRLSSNGAFDPTTARAIGAVDVGQLWLTGNLDSSNWAPGASGDLSGTATVYSQNLASALPVMGSQSVYLEMIFDGEGRQTIANPEFMSHRLTPTKFPIERRGGKDPVRIGELAFGAFSKLSDRHGEASWQLNYRLPVDLPAGIYQLVLLETVAQHFTAPVSGLEQGTLHHEEVYPVLFDSPLTTGGATQIRVGSPAQPRLTLTLGMNDFSNGSRGTVALEDRSHFGISTHVKNNARHFVVPAVNVRNGKPYVYNLEPFAPLIGADNRGWMNPPMVPFAYPSGSLSAQITRSDGSTVRIGDAAFAQPYLQVPSTLNGGLLSGNKAMQYFGLTTRDPNFHISFDEYGLHTVTLNGYLDDVYGNRYNVSGTYEIYVANTLDLEYGVFDGTPFEVGDVFSSTVIVQPGIPADIEVLVSLYPDSDPARLIEYRAIGRANRFGYFQASESGEFVMSQPGEYRVDITASYVDETGALWVGSRSWGSIVETPDSPVIAHGKRSGGNSPDSGQQWFLMNANHWDNHFLFPFHSGDVVWMKNQDGLDRFGNSHSMVLQSSVQDTRGTLANLARQRLNFKYQLESVIAKGEIPLISTSLTQISPFLNPHAQGNIWAYAYSSAARPGVSVREIVSEDDTGNTYWRFDDAYHYQPGNGANGDLPNDFKFMFNGTVYRAPDQDYFNYASYGSLWVQLPDSDVLGGRVFPPFQGAAGGPSGGPIMTLQGKEIDIFLHPMGVRAGTILEVGDIASFSGQVGPTLASKIAVSITAPDGTVRNINGKANKIGYFYDPSADFVADQPGIYTVDVEVWHDGETSAGPVEAPYPRGDALGSSNGRYEFYVAPVTAQVLDADLAARSIVRPADGPLSFPFEVPEGLSNVQLYHTAVMPGFILRQGSGSNATYTYDAQELAQNFPNLDLHDEDYRAGADTVTLSFMLSGTRSDGSTAYLPRQILLQGEELIVLQPPVAATASVQISLNSEALRGGDPFKLDMTVNGTGEVDLYVALLFPDGNFVTVGSPLALSDLNQVIPFKLAQSLTQTQLYNVADIDVPLGMESGEYQIYGIAVRRGHDPLDITNWLSGAQQNFQLLP